MSLISALQRSFAWLQRPENVLDGKITWADYRSPDKPRHVRVFHHKTGEVVWMPLENDSGPLYPELDAYLGGLARLRLPIVLTSGERGPARPYAHVYAQRRLREARVAGVRHPRCMPPRRHEELGDAGFTEQGVMTLSGHKTPQAARLYIKRTERQRTTAARQRRTWVEENEAGSEVRMGRQKRSQNDSSDNT